MFFLNKKTNNLKLFVKKQFGVPTRTRTVDPLIKSQLLYQLSYGDKLHYNNSINKQEIQ